MNGEDEPTFEYDNTLDDDIIAEIENGEMSATIVVADDAALDGWTMQIFPTVSNKRVILGVSRSYVCDLVEDLDGEELFAAHEKLVGEAITTVHNYFQTTFGE